MSICEQQFQACIRGVSRIAARQPAKARKVARHCLRQQQKCAKKTKKRRR